ncbi:hypothetical protein SCUCBS95973_007693 [Sporothrix curviconia]|uniref:Uncharacterized protein n=1 Tax=Sporothrix curviconia TaxID=1260050 RepID=A0ABP0CG50_9PEZI
MGDGDLMKMVSPVEANIDVTMTDDHAFDANTVPAPSASETRPTEAAAAAAETRTAQVAIATTAAPQPTQEKGKALPRVTSVVPAMFVPLAADADLTQPFDAPRSRTERAQVMLDTLDYYYDGVRQGFVYLADLDRRRIVGAAEAREEAIENAWAAAKAASTADPATGAATGPAGEKPGEKQQPPQPPLPPQGDETLSPEEMDAMITAMRAPAIPGVDYNMIPTLDQQPLPIRFPPPGDEVPGGRRESVRLLGEVVEQVLMQMSGYGGHMSQLRGRWRETLDREQKRLDEQFGALHDTATTAAPAEKQGNAGGGAAAAAPAPTETPDVAMSGA